ncbi:hypothetical protein B9479_005884 [Cryptococcus floricola]|uniref:IPT/TIG domain-containing protein n=1 Tax=Cryptococcus floricola TaxID=2591691 RepID=A0A5D3AS12_9TREE|nr:hypothetical protein B9479_005884 [Cryptococcus floricola]
MDSSSASSPFSTRSTLESSPEAQGANGGHGGKASGNGLVSMIMGGINGSFSQHAQQQQSPYNYQQDIKPFQQQYHNHQQHQSFPAQQDVKPFAQNSPIQGQGQIPAPMSSSRLSERMNAIKSPAESNSGMSQNAPTPAGSSNHGGSRAEAPKRKHELEGTNVVAPSLDEVAQGSNGLNQILLQGDPQTADKSRVETAIRIIIDLLRFAPLHTSPPPPISLHPVLPLGPNGEPLYAFERIATFHGLRLQAGTTTKTSSKKQLQAIGHIPKEKLAYLETAVYMSGEGDGHGKRIYVCKRCRNREARRREAKDRNRKRAQPATSDSDSSPHPRLPRQSLVPPSIDFVTSENPDDYDPKRAGQVVEEPSWDPDVPDWRHEIVLFNTPSEVKMEDGSCNWLPFRVVCYGKCHGEKVGFKIKFTMRTHDGRIIASAFTKPIRITDDHKTDTSKPKATKPLTNAVDGPAQAPVPRRKARPSVAGSTASVSASVSRQQSPTPSESESVQSFQSLSEAGAVMQKQTPSARTKPYERPQPQVQAQGPQQAPSPVSYITNQMAGLPSANFHTTLGQLTPGNPEGIQHTHQMRSSTSPQQALPTDLDMSQFINTVSPHQLRGPQFTQQMPGNNFNVHRSSASSVASSTGASPRNNFQGLGEDMLSNNNMFNHNLFDSMRMGGNQQPNGVPGQDVNGPMLYPGHETDLANLMSSNFSHLLSSTAVDSSRNSSIAGSIDNDGASSSAASAWSGWDDRSSVFSQSGLPPGSTVVDDFEGLGVGMSAGSMGAMGNGGAAEGEDMEKYLDYPTEQQGMGQSGGLGSPARGVNFPGLPFDNLQSQYQHQPSLFPSPAAQPQAPTSPQPTITDVIPEQGPMAGGPMIAVGGTDFQPGMVVLFGQRAAVTVFQSSGFMKCKLPPSPYAEVVDVTIQGVGSGTGAQDRKTKFAYQDMEKDAMKLVLAIQSQYQGSSANTTQRLHQLPGQNNGHWSSNGGPSSSASPQGPSPGGNTMNEATNVTAAFSPDAEEEGEDTDSQTSSMDSKSTDSMSSDLQSTLIAFLASIDSHAPGSLRASGAINCRNEYDQTLLHIAVVLGYSRLVRRLILGGAEIDSQDNNGYTPLAFAALCGKCTCARVLIEAGACYDRATNYGEMPLDLAKVGEHGKVERLLLSAVWSTVTDPAVPTPAAAAAPVMTGKKQAKQGESPKSVATSLASSIDDDNPSSGSEAEVDLAEITLSVPSTRRKSKSRKSTSDGKGMKSTKKTTAAKHGDSTSAIGTDGVEADQPPPYAPPTDHSRVQPPADDDHPSGWIKTLSNLPHLPHLPHINQIPNGVWEHFPSRPSFLGFDKTPAESSEGQNGGWIAFPAPSWDTIQRMASPDEVKLFTQAMAAAALNAVVQTGVATPPSKSSRRRDVRKTLSPLGLDSDGVDGQVKRGSGNEDGEPLKSSSRDRRRRYSNGASGSGTGSGGTKIATRKSEKKENVVSQVKSDRMLYLFWLPILLFVGFWLLVSALPIATGFGLIYARKITRAIKQRM